MVVNHVSVGVVVVDNFGVAESLHNLFSIDGEVSFFLQTLFMQCPIGQHYLHDVVGFLHPIQIEPNPIQFSTDCICLSHLFVVEVLNDSIPWNMFWPVSSFFDEGMCIDAVLLQLHQPLQDTETRVKNHSLSCPKL